MGLTEKRNRQSQYRGQQVPPQTLDKTHYPPTKKDCQQVTVFVAIFHLSFLIVYHFKADCKHENIPPHPLIPFSAKSFLYPLILYIPLSYRLFNTPYPFTTPYPYRLITYPLNEETPYTKTAYGVYNQLSKNQPIR